MSASGVVSWQVMYRRHGKQSSSTFDTEAGASSFARLIDDVGVERALEVLEARERAGAAQGPSPTLAAFGHGSLDARTGIDPATRQRYHRQLDSVFGSLLQMPIDAIMHDDVRAWVNRTAAAKKEDGSPKTSGKTLSNWRGLLSSIFKEALRQGLVTSNPCVGIRISRTEQREMTFLTPSEFAHVLAHTRSYGSGMVALMAATGLRFGEASALQVRDVDFGSGTLTVSRAWKESEDDEPAADGKRATRKRVLGPPKSKKSRRTIHVPGQVLDILTTAAAGLSAEDFFFRTPGRTDGERDWNAKAGVPWTHDKFGRRVWVPAIHAARSEALHDAKTGTCQYARLVKDPRVHDLRHTAASWMLAGGTPIAAVSRHLGHESITTTVDRYGHLDPSVARQAADAAAAALSTAIPLSALHHG
jgi:integrase